jgi:hypothetical protein
MGRGAAEVHSQKALRPEVPGPHAKCLEQSDSAEYLNFESQCHVPH